MKVLLLDYWGERARGILGEVAEVEYNPFNATYPSCGQYDGIVSCLFDKISCLSIKNPVFDEKHGWLNKNLKFIASCTTGTDHIDVAYCRENGIKVISLQGETDFLRDVYATAEHTFALILSLIRKVPFAHNDVCTGNWEREKWQGTELYGKNIAVIGGNGRVGSQVVKLAKAFGMNVNIIEPNLGLTWEKMGLDGINLILPYSDIVTVHIRLSDALKGFFDYEQFCSFKRGCLFVNTSRGQLVDEDALIQHLEEGHIRGAALDVINGEPDIGARLLDYAKTHNNLIITPHLGGNTAESREKTQVFIANKIKKYISAQGGASL